MEVKYSCMNREVESTREKDKGSIGTEAFGIVLEVVNEGVAWELGLTGGVGIWFDIVSLLGQARGGGKVGEENTRKENME